MILTKSAKSNAWDGVFGPPNPAIRPPPPGVVIIDEGKAMLRGGGVDGGYMRLLPVGLAGEGEVARYNNRSAPSWPDFPLFLKLLLCPEVARPRPEGGVRGGEEPICMEVILKECMGSISSSSSDPAIKFCVWLSPGKLEVPRKSDMSGPADVVKCEYFLGLIGED